MTSKESKPRGPDETVIRFEDLAPREHVRGGGPGKVVFGSLGHSFTPTPPAPADGDRDQVKHEPRQEEE